MVTLPSVQGHTGLTGLTGHAGKEWASECPNVKKITKGGLDQYDAELTLW